MEASDAIQHTDTADFGGVRVLTHRTTLGVRVIANPTVPVTLGSEEMSLGFHDGFKPAGAGEQGV